MHAATTYPNHLELDRLPAIDISANLLAVLRAERAPAGVVREMLDLRTGPGRLTLQECL